MLGTKYATVKFSLLGAVLKAIWLCRVLLSYEISKSRANNMNEQHCGFSISYQKVKLAVTQNWQ